MVTGRIHTLGLRVLDTKMQPNDAQADTIGEYLIALLRELWACGSGFSPKRPFGSSDWELELVEALGKADIIKVRFDADGYVEDVDYDEVHRVMTAAIDALGQPPRPRTTTSGPSAQCANSVK